MMITTYNINFDSRDSSQSTKELAAMCGVRFIENWCTAKVISKDSEGRPRSPWSVVPGFCIIIAYFVLWTLGQISFSAGLFSAESYIVVNSRAVQYALQNTILVGCDGLPLDASSKGEDWFHSLSSILSFSRENSPLTINPSSNNLTHKRLSMVT
jgi:hypothetical protein